MLKLALLLSVLALTSQAARGRYRVMTAGYSKTSYSYSFTDGHLDELFVFDVEDNLTFMQYDADTATLYAVHEVTSYGDWQDTGVVSRWRVEFDEDGAPVLTKLQVLQTGGAGPCHVLVDKNLGYAFISNYVGGSFTAHSVDKETGEFDLKFSMTAQFLEGSGVIPDRQESPHVHGVAVYGNFIYVADLGADKIYGYRVLESGGIGDLVDVDAPPGSGPRHLSVDQSRGLLYVIYELKSLIEVYKIDDNSGWLELFQAVDLLAGSPIPEEVWNYPFQAAAELETHPNGKWMYFSNRITGAIVAFEIEDDGKLTFLQFVYTAGVMPRHFKISPDGLHLLVTLQNANFIEVFSVDQETGRLTKTEEDVSNNSPTMIVYLA